MSTGDSEVTAGSVGWESRAQRSRLSVTVLFLLAGSVFGGWAGRTPLNQGSARPQRWPVGLVILAVPIGTLLALMLLTRLITRTGARLLAVPGAVVLLLITPLAALSTSRRALVCAGRAAGLLFSPMNAFAVLVERDYPKSSKNSFRPRARESRVPGPVAPPLGGARRLRRRPPHRRVPPARPRPTAAAPAPRPPVPPQPRAGRPRRRTRAPHPRVGPGYEEPETA